MLAEIHQQANLAQVWAQGGYPVQDVADAVAAFAPQSIALVARGTSDNAAGYAKYLLEILGGYLVSSTSPSTMTLYGARPRPARTLCIAVSQSGQSPDLIRAMAAFRAVGSLGIVVTNDPSSPLASEADHVIDLAAGMEQAVAATKTFTCSLLALLDLATAICGATPPDRASIASAIQSAIQPTIQPTIPSADTSPILPVSGQHLTHAADPSSIRSAHQSLEHVADPSSTRSAHQSLAHAADLIGQAMRAAGHLLVVSRGASTPIAHEGALKIMETVGLPALSYSAADLEHGPIACVHPGTPVIATDSVGPATHSLHPVIRRLIDRGAVVVQVGSAEPVPGVQGYVPVGRLDPLAAPIAEAIPMQLLAYHLATAAGRDPDRPEGLSKVTLTQ